ncbi:hypothetical protein [Cognatilysobacter terrigena]|uniref:hypothetical protein n=1 Tax=Cognatilysobacter terrigena TaxID=2488749 RepID=UPI001AAD0804|nr:hypothetical protein [Lysobacter terrigena]
MMRERRSTGHCHAKRIQRELRQAKAMWIEVDARRFSIGDRRWRSMCGDTVVVEPGALHR